MPIINISKSDLQGGEVIPPGWYKAEVISFKVKPPKSGGDSLNYEPRFKIYAKGSNVDERELNHTFNSQAIGRMAPFIAAVKEMPLKQIVDGLQGNTLQFDTDEAIGKKLQIKIKNEPYDGRMTNKIDDFAAYDAAPAF